MDDAWRITMLRLLGITKRRSDSKTQTTVSSHRPAGILEQRNLTFSRQ
jgi:hypothetical protein